MAKKLDLPPLQGGGLAVGWKCSSRCRHCLYGSGPHRLDGKPTEGKGVDSLLDMCAEKGGDAAWHIGGGEPFLDIPLLRRVIEGFTRRGLNLEYVETNAFWALDQTSAEKTLRELAPFGLRSLLVSLSPFHAEFVPFNRTANLIRAAENTLPNGAFIWIPEFCEDLRGFDPERTIDLGKLLKEMGDEYALGIVRRYHLVPLGRAGRFLAAHGRIRPWDELVGDAPCRSRLRDTSHFHVDGDGNYIPGLCAGLAIPFSRIGRELDMDGFPVLGLLADGKLADLKTLADRHGFKPAVGYSSACDFCLHLRFFLATTLPGEFPELKPDQFYSADSVPGFPLPA